MKQNFNNREYREKIYLIYPIKEEIHSVEDFQEIKSSIKADDQTMIMQWFKTMMHDLEVFCICRTDGKQMYIYCEPMDENCSVKYFVGDFLNVSLISYVTYEKEEADRIFKQILLEKKEIEKFFKKMLIKYNHKTLEERAAEFGDKINVDCEFDSGKPEGREMW